MSLCINGVLHFTHEIAYPKESQTIETILCPYMSVAPATEEPLQHTAQQELSTLF